MTVAKRFRWEAAHRLADHPSLCRNLHGHSYTCWIELDGTPGPSEMLIDFQEVKRVLSPLIDAWDHCTYVNRNDEALHSALATLGVKHYLLDGRSTTEALAKYVARYLCTHGFDMLNEHGVTAIQVRVQETETCYATTRATVSDYATTPAPNLGDALVEPEAVAG